ncbi:MAG: uroporphyrinogen decarboxylase family protein [Planctomycetaceae bacterium]|nr:hypothetical protein [Planctomycetaceae bacterium]
MSIKRALAAIAGEKVDRVAQFEFLTHEAFFRSATGIDPRTKPTESYLAYLEKFDIDATLFAAFGATDLTDGQVAAAGDHHVRTAWGMRETQWMTNPIYKTRQEILDFDPRRHDDISLAQRIDGWCRNYRDTQALLGERSLLVPGHFMLVLHYMPYYCDWTLFMEMVATEPESLRPMLDRCTDYSVDTLTAMAATDAPMLMAHEDLCSARGPIFSPAFLRREVFPRYQRIYEPAIKAGKKVLATSDGLIEPIAKDFIAAGATGLFMEAMNDPDTIIDAVGPRGQIVGGASTTTLTTGTPETIAAEVAATLKKAKRLPGFFICLGGEAPQNVPVENLQAYFDACRLHR